MSLPLPPRAIIRCDEANARLVDQLLTSVIAGHPQATTTYRFYEEVDQWLGPWGPQGYPIGYGKFYNVAFSTNQNLHRNPVTRDWVWRTTILLQELLRDYIVGCVRNCTIPTLTEAQLRQAAFNSHPRAYDQGGLGRVALAAPELIPIIGTIPAAEFLPTAQNCSSSWRQVFSTLGLVAPGAIGTGLGALAGPAHTGILRRGFLLDQQRRMNEQALARELGNIGRLIERGELDYIPVLDLVIERLNAREFPDQGFAGAARDVVERAQARRERLVHSYRILLNQAPGVRARIEHAFPGLLRPAAR